MFRLLRSKVRARRSRRSKLVPALSANAPGTMRGQLDRLTKQITDEDLQTVSAIMSLQRSLFIIPCRFLRRTWTCFTHYILVTAQSRLNSGRCTLPLINYHGLLALMMYTTCRRDWDLVAPPPTSFVTPYDRLPEMVDNKVLDKLAVLKFCGGLGSSMGRLFIVRYGPMSAMALCLFDVQTSPAPSAR